MKDWKEKFDEKFPHIDEACNCCGGAIQYHSKGGQYKSFIQSLLDEQREELKEAVIKTYECMTKIKEIENKKMNLSSRYSGPYDASVYSWATTAQAYLSSIEEITK